MFLPLNTAYTVDELSYFIENSSARTVVCDGGSKTLLDPVVSKLGARLETLNADGSGSLTDQAKAKPSEFATVNGRRTIWPLSFTPPAPPGGPRGQC